MSTTTYPANPVERIPLSQTENDTTRYLQQSRLPSVSKTSAANSTEGALAISIKVARLMDRLDSADLSRQARDYTGADLEYASILAELNDFGNSPGLKARALVGLAVCADVAHCKEDAIKHYEAAVKIYEGMESSAHWTTHSAILNNLAILYRGLDRSVDAEACYVKAINKHEKLKEASNTEQLILLYSNLACLYYNIGIYDAAITIQTRALKLRLEVPSPEKTKLFEILRALGIFHVLAGNLNEGIKLLERAKEIVRKLIPPDYEATVELLVNLGSAYISFGKNAEALSTHEEAADLLERTKGRNDLLLAQVLKNIGYLHSVAGRQDKAYEANIRSLRILNDNPAGEDTARAEVYHNLATVCDALNRKQQAAAFRQCASDLLHAVAADCRDKIIHATKQNETLPSNSKTPFNSERLFVRFAVSVEAPRRSRGNLTPPLRTETVEIDL